MSRYVEQNLLPDERVCYSARLSLWALSKYLVLAVTAVYFDLGYPLGIFLFEGSTGGVLLGNAALFIGLIGAAALKYYTTELVVTNRRVFAKFGFIKRISVELLLGKVESIQVKQSITGRIFNYGSIVVAGGGMYSAPVPDIAEPLRFRAECTKAQAPVH